MGWTRFFRRAQWDAERARELQSYIEIETDANIARGMSSADARDAAIRKLGNPTQIREQIYEMNTVSFIEHTWRDLRFGLRLLRRNPTFAVVAILTLMLGTGANAAIFQLVNALRLRQLPVERPEQLAEIQVDTHDKGHVGWSMGRTQTLSEPLWRALSAEQKAFSHLFAYSATEWNLATDGNYRPANGLFVSGQFFDGLGVQPEIGRLLHPADDRPGCGQAGAVLSHAFWQSKYGGSQDVLGRRITLDGHAFEIVGVTPRSFFGLEVGRSFDVAIPLCAEPRVRGEGSGFGHGSRWFLDAMGRLKDGWTPERATAHLHAISSPIFASTMPTTYNPEMAKNYATFRFEAREASRGLSELREEYARHLWILLGATGLVLLIACANLANLMLARATAREREMAVRLAIGASRGRIVRQMLSESLVLAGIGSAAGALLALWLSRMLVTFLSTESDQIFLDLSPDWRVFAFIAGLAVLACLIFGASPALAATSASPGRSLQSAGRSHTDSRHPFVMRRTLVIAQVALSMVLVVGALLFVRTLQGLANVDPGFRTEGVTTLRVDLRRAGIAPEARPRAFEQILAAVREVPGVQRASQVMILPLAGMEWNGRIQVNGALSERMVYFNQVSQDYFRTLDIPLIAGRAFDTRDRIGSPPVAVVNQAFARRYFPGQSPIGQTFGMEAGPDGTVPRFEIVGLVRDTKYLTLREETKEIVLLASSQETRLMPFMEMVVRSDLSLAGLSASVTPAVTRAAPGATVSYASVTAAISDSLATARLMASLSGLFGILALVIATVGLYGVMSYTVARRRAEIGVRIVLGADPRQIVRMVLGESGLLLLVGVAIGVVLAAVSSQWASSLLFGLSPWDATSFVAAATALSLVSLLAAWLPAHRASHIEPTLALRE